MSKKDTSKENKKEKKEEKKDDLKWQFGVAPSLIITIVREQRVYRFEMPIGAHLNECEEACNECLNVVKKMKEEGERKMAEEKAKKEKEESKSFDEDLTQ